jgi:hypothetical protein
MSNTARPLFGAPAPSPSASRVLARRRANEGAIGRTTRTYKADVTQREGVCVAVDHAERELGGFDRAGSSDRWRRGLPLSGASPVHAGEPKGMSYR